MSKNTRKALSLRRPLRPKDVATTLSFLTKLSQSELEAEVARGVTYDEARQLCHELGIKQIKGNCRKVLTRRITRLRTVDKTGRLAQLLGEVVNV